MNNKAHLRPKDFDSNGDIIPMSMKEEKGDLISREALLKEVRENKELYEKERVYLEGLLLNAPAVEILPENVIEAHTKIGYERGFNDGYAKCVEDNERQQINIFCENADEKAITDMKEELQKVIDDIRPHGEWISVSERLPNKNGRCLVTTDFGDVCMDSFVDGIFILYLGNVIAWKPLPEPYQKGGAE